jgi:hypothetical protein
VSPLADRRSRLRYEVVGVLRGTLELSIPVRLQNISGDGALLESAAPIAVGATQSIQISVAGQTTRVTSCVRHVTLIGQSPETRYAVGVEFVSPSDVLQSTVASLAGRARTGGLESVDS